MTKPKYPHVIALTEQEEAELKALRKKGLGVIDVFRKGLKEAKKN